MATIQAEDVHWEGHLLKIEPCLFPVSKTNSVRQKNEIRAILIPVQNAARLDSLLQEHKSLYSSLIQVAWALVLRCYAGTNVVSFAPVDHQDGNVQYDARPQTKDGVVYVRVCHC